VRIAQVIVTHALIKTLVRLAAALIISITLSAMEAVLSLPSHQGQIVLIVGAIVMFVLMETPAPNVPLATIFINLSAM